MREKLILVVMGMLFLGFMLVDVDAFCIINRTDKVIYVKQTSGGTISGSFGMYIERDGEYCCHWSDKECNTSVKRDAKVAFLVSYVSNDSQTYICSNFTIKAHEWLKVEGSNGSYRCVRIDY